MAAGGSGGVDRPCVLRDGDEAVFVELVDASHTRLVHFARTFVSSGPAAEDVAQDTWVAVIKGLERFEQRSNW